MERWHRIKNLPQEGLGENGSRVTGSKEHIEFSRTAATEGMVLLKNDGVLPLAEGTKIAIFGKAQIDYIKGGSGSGDVHCEYIRNVYEGFKIKEAEGKIEIYHPLSQWYEKYIKENPRPYCEALAYEILAEEAEITDSQVAEVRRNADVAIVTICRYSGEGYDRTEDDFYLTEKESKMVEAVCREFDKVIAVLNVGGIVDTEWFADNDKISASLLAWNGGMEGGLAIADILVGDVSPSGKLADTFAKTFGDYPSSDTFHESEMYVKYYEDIYVGYRYFETIPGAYEKVNYPFGFGLSYTTFELSNTKVWADKDTIKINVQVKNTGTCAGKEVVQVYYSAPQGLLGKPAKELGAFAKTKTLAPNEVQELELEFPVYYMASFDDLGKISKSAYILEKGDYSFYIGTSVRDTEKAEFVYTLNENKVIEQLRDLVVPERLEKRMLSDGTFEALPTPMPRTFDYFKEPVTKLPDGKVSDTPITFDMVAENPALMDDFIDQMGAVDMVNLLGGKDDRGIANTAGIGARVNEPEGVNDLGIPCLMTADGPAGLRTRKNAKISTTAFPCATLLACTWNTDIMYEKGRIGATEVEENNLSIWLTPGMNIHRNPLCGRNFEYFSEDPIISGKMASAEVRGIQSRNISACPKHFACNNKETLRVYSNSIVSERALREIYLKGFEICVKEADPWLIMTSYNLVNGVRTPENPELITGILRGEWGYKGLVTTDWGSYSNQTCELCAGNDIKMWHGNNPIWVALSCINVNPYIRKSVKRLLEFILKFD